MTVFLTVSRPRQKKDTVNSLTSLGADSEKPRHGAYELSFVRLLKASLYDNSPALSDRTALKDVRKGAACLGPVRGFLLCQRAFLSFH